MSFRQQHPYQGRPAAPSCETCTVRERTICAHAHSRPGPRERITLARGEALTYQGDTVASVHVVESGLLVGHKMLADGRRQIVALFHPGDVVQFEADAADRAIAGFTVEAASAAGVCRYARGQLMAEIGYNGRLGRDLLERTERALQASHELMLAISHGSARMRVAFLLLRLSAMAQARGEPVTPIWLPLSREAIGDHLGLTMETISRVLSSFRREGLIAQHGHDDHIALTDIDGLNAAAEHPCEPLPNPA